MLVTTLISCVDVAAVAAGRQVRGEAAAAAAPEVAAGPEVGGVTEMTSWRCPTTITSRRSRSAWTKD